MNKNDTKLQKKVVSGLKAGNPSALAFCKLTTGDVAGLNAALLWWVLADRKRKPRLPQ